MSPTPPRPPPPPPAPQTSPNCPESLANLCAARPRFRCFSMSRCMRLRPWAQDLGVLIVRCWLLGMARVNIVCWL